MPLGRWRRILLRSLLIASGLLTAGVLGLAIGVDRFGQMERARPASAIVVLGARVLEGGVPSDSLRARVEKAVELYRRGFATRVLFSGGVGKHSPAEAMVARSLAVALGVPESACLVEADSHSTAENARFSARLLRQHGLADAVLVSDPYHLLRARQYFRREGIQVHPSPALSSGRNLRGSERLYWTLREAFALLFHPWLLWA